jgi:hypothetical protein
MRYRLRTLLIVLAIGPPALAWAFVTFQRYAAKQEVIIWPGGVIINGSVCEWPPGDMDDGVMTMTPRR